MNLESIIIIIDFKKAYDTLLRGKMLSILKAYGIPEELVEAIAIMFSNLAGVLGGDTLSPYIFIIVIGYIMRKALMGREDKLGFQLRKRQKAYLKN